jgi:hypothetical protein
MNEASASERAARLHEQWNQQLLLCNAAIAQMRSLTAPDQLVAVDLAAIDEATQPPRAAEQRALPHFALRA